MAIPAKDTRGHWYNAYEIRPVGMRALPNRNKSSAGRAIRVEVRVEADARVPSRQELDLHALLRATGWTTGQRSATRKNET